MARKSKTPSKGTSKKNSKPKTPPPATQKNNLNRYFKVVDLDSVSKKDEISSSPKKNTLNKFHESKRVKKLKDSDQTNDDDNQQDCKYGEKCYQTSEEHLKNFTHTKKNSKESVVKKVSPKKKEKVYDVSDSDEESNKKPSKKKRKVERVEPQISDDDSETKLDSDDGKNTSDDSIRKRKTEKKSNVRVVKKVSPKKKEKVHDVSDSDEESKNCKVEMIEPQISDNEDSETKLDSENDRNTTDDSIKKRKTEKNSNLHVVKKVSPKKKEKVNEISDSDDESKKTSSKNRKVKVVEPQISDEESENDKTTSDHIIKRKTKKNSKDNVAKEVSPKKKEKVHEISESDDESKKKCILEPQISDNDDNQQDCKYGEKCYQTSEEHLRKFNHPKKSSVKKVSPKKKEKVNDISDSDDQIKKKRKVKPQISEDDSETKLDFDDDKTTSDDRVKKSKTGNMERKMARKKQSDENDDSSESKNSKEKSIKLKPSDLEEKIKSIYGVEGMPTDFYHFWKFCTTLSPKNPLNALKEALNLKLVGPFEILNDLESFSMEDEAEKDEILLKHRFYYDPPEFQTCVISTEDSKKDEKLAGYHFGYYRDDPKSKSAFVAFNTPGAKYTPTSCKINPLGDNLFGAMSSEIAHRLQQIPKSDKTNREVLEKLKNRLKRFMNDRELTYSLDRVTQSMKARQKTILTKCFHGAGICVKVENDVGYRELPETDANLRLLLTKISNKKANPKNDLNAIMEPIEKMVTLVQFANDECDFGMGLELGLDLFCYGDPALHPYVNQLLPLAYQLIDRPAYVRVIQAHLKNRDKMIGSNHWITETDNI